MSTRPRLAIVSNLTKGGGPLYKNCVVEEFSKKYDVDEYSPNPFLPKNKNKLLKLFEYVHYVYVHLPKYYLNLGVYLNNKKYAKIIVFQDSYLKTPHIFKTLKNKSIYILHEPPREFYEKISMHSGSLRQIIFTFTVRLPVFFIDRINIKYANVVVTNSKFSKILVEKIYNKKSHVVYPGFRFKPGRVFRKIHQCISVGGLQNYKGHNIVVKAISLVPKNVRPKLLVVGSGLKKQIERLLAQAKNDNVQIEIIKNPSDKILSRHFSNSLIYVNGAYCEPFGMAALEAIGHGCHLVTNNTGGTKELKKYFDSMVSVCNYDAFQLSRKILANLEVAHKLPSMSNFSWAEVVKKIDIL